MLSYLVLLYAIVAVTLAQKVSYNKRMKTATLEIHNKLREEARQHGAKMKDLKWSYKLQRFAEAQIARCQYAHTHNNKYGENLYYYAGSERNKVELAKEACTLWGDEKNLVNRGWYCMQNGGCLHYSQQVWPETRAVGCAMQKCYGGKVLVFCEYHPRGNMNVRENHPYKV